MKNDELQDTLNSLAKGIQELINRDEYRERNLMKMMGKIDNMFHAYTILHDSFTSFFNDFTTFLNDNTGIKNGRVRKNNSKTKI